MFFWKRNRVKRIKKAKKVKKKRPVRNEKDANYVWNYSKGGWGPLEECDLNEGKVSFVKAVKEESKSVSINTDVQKKEKSPRSRQNSSFKSMEQVYVNPDIESSKSGKKKEPAKLSRIRNYVSYLSYLKTACEGTRLKDYEVVKKIGGKEFSVSERSYSFSKSQHGACGAVFIVKLRKQLKGGYEDEELALKMVYRYGSKKMSKNEFDLIVQNNSIERIEFTIMNPVHTFVNDYSIHDQLSELMDKDIICEKETVFLVFPKCDMDLAHLIKRKGVPFERKIWRRIVYQLLWTGDILLYNEKITHRDLKPDNILITNEKMPSIIITDWEFHKRGIELIIKEGMCRGGAAFYCPPWIHNAKEGEKVSYDRYDNFSILLIAYKMLSEEDPFGGKLPKERTPKDYVPLTNEAIDKDIREFVNDWLPGLVNDRGNWMSWFKEFQRKHAIEMAGYSFFDPYRHFQSRFNK